MPGIGVSIFGFVAGIPALESETWGTLRLFQRSRLGREGIMIDQGCFDFRVKSFRSMASPIVLVTSVIGMEVVAWVSVGRNVSG